MRLHTCDKCKQNAEYLLADNALSAKEIQDEKLICAICFAQKDILTIESVCLNQYYRAYKSSYNAIESRIANEAKKERMITGFLALNARLDTNLVKGIDQEYLNILAQEKIAKDQEIARANKAFEANNNCTI